MILITLLSPWTLLALFALYYILPYLRRHELRDIPGPKLAALSNLWLLYQCRRGRRSLAVDEAHKKYGPIVRIQPNHISIADPEAIAVIYSHSGGWLKSEYYDAFVSIQRGLFNTRDRAEHTRKRRMISHTFSAKSITEFEPYIKCNLEELVKQWNNLSDAATRGGKAYAEIDALHWFNYLAFDIIGDLAFGAPFGMLPKGADIAEVKITPDSPTTYAPAVQVLNRRGEVCSTLGCLPSLKPYAGYLPDPFFRNGLRAVKNLAGIAVARVNARIAASASAEAEGKAGGGPGARKDLLARLMESRDENGEKLGREELTAEALTQLIAGSDTTSNTSCAGLYWCLRTPGVMEKLQAELDAAIPAGVVVPTYEMVKDLPYLHNTINEILRIHSTSSLGLPRVVPPGPPTTTTTTTTPTINHKNRPLPSGTALSIPTYTLHHSPQIWNPTSHPPLAPSNFNPSRWDPPNLTPLQKKSFIPFSQGPRACVGRNVAEMELKLIFATVVGGRGFEFLLREEEEEEGGGLGVREGFLRKPVRCLVGVRRKGRGGG